MSTDLTKRTAARVEARKAADTIGDMVVDEAARLAEECSPDASREFLETLRDKLVTYAPLPKVPPRVLPVKPMSEEEARQFENRKMPFGKHADMPLSQVELSYLLWLDNESDFRQDLRRYLASERVQREQSE